MNKPDTTQSVAVEKVIKEFKLWWGKDENVLDKDGIDVDSDKVFRFFLPYLQPQSVAVENIRKRFVGRVESVLMKYYTVIEGKCLDDLLEVLYPDQPTKDSSNKLNESEESR